MKIFWQLSLPAFLATLVLFSTTQAHAGGNCLDEDDIEQWAGRLGLRDKDAAQHIKWEDEAKLYDDTHPVKEKRRIFVFGYFDTDVPAADGWPIRRAGDAMIFYVKRSRTDAEIHEILRAYYGGSNRHIYKGK